MRDRWAKAIPVLLDKDNGAVIKLRLDTDAWPSLRSCAADLARSFERAGSLMIIGDPAGSKRSSTEHIEARGLDEETTEANLWLIAAAPDLLAALERILARVEMLDPCRTWQRSPSLPDHAVPKR